MKGKVIVLLIVGLLAGGSAVYATTSNYYADLLIDQKDKIMEELKFSYTDNMNSNGKAVNDEVLQYAENQGEALRERMNDYLHEKLEAKQTDKVDYYKTTIDESVVQMEKELKHYIDNLVKGDNVE